MTEITDKEILVNRIYPAISNCVSNRSKIIAGIFSLYAFIVSSLNANKEIINLDVTNFIAWIFTFFVVHNSFNYASNAWEQYNLEETGTNKKSTSKRLWHIFRAEGFFMVVMLAIIWLGYHFVIKEIWKIT